MPDEGEEVTFFEGANFLNDNEPFKSNDHPGKVILLSFLQYEQRDSGDFLPCLERLWNDYSDHCVQVVAIFPEIFDDAPTTPNETALMNFLNDNGGVTFPVIHSVPEIWNNYRDGLESTGDYDTRPHSFIIKKNDLNDNMIILKRYCGIDCDLLEGLLSNYIDIRDPIDFEMVMDVSGSMNSIPPNAVETKYEMMKQAITIVGNYLRDNAHCHDRMGLIWFTDDASEYSRDNQKLFQIKTNWDELSVQVNSHGTGNCTAMGAGLQTAFNTLSSSTQKFIILCTDGMQNINPMVLDVTETDGSVHYRIINDDVRYRECGSPSQIEPSGIDIDSYETCVHTIGIGIIEDYGTLLDGIATNTQGFYQGTNDPENELLGDYLVALLDCLGRGSPSILYSNNGSLSVEEHEKTETFYLNSSVRKLTVILSWKKSQGSNFMFWLYSPDGALLDLHNEMRIYEHHCMATIYLPKRQNGDNLEYIGEWRMMIRGEIPNSSADYHVIIIGEDKDIKLVFDFPRKRFEVGDIIPIKVFVLKKKKPLAIEPKEITVEKKLLSTPLPELIAKYKISPNELLEKTKTIPDRAPKNLLNLKLKVMTSDPKFQKSLMPDIKRLSLQKGNLECKFEKEEVIIPIALEQPGLHNFKIRARYESPEDGPICRTHMISIIVEPGKVDPKQSDFRKKGKMIYITPRNKKGQLLGPGYSRKFKLKAGEKEYDIEFKDLLDGTYQIEVPEKETEEIKEKGLDVDITFRKNLIWRRKL